MNRAVSCSKNIQLGRRSLQRLLKICSKIKYQRVVVVLLDLNSHLDRLFYMILYFVFLPSIDSYQAVEMTFLLCKKKSFHMGHPFVWDFCFKLVLFKCLLVQLCRSSLQLLGHCFDQMLSCNGGLLNNVGP